MGIARSRATELRLELGWDGIPTDEQIDEALTRLGIRLIEDCEDIPTGEVYVGGVVGLGCGLRRAWKRWLKAHALAHHVLHRGNQFRISELLKRRQERQANEFAAWLILGGLQIAADAQLTAWHIADSADIPVQFVAHWLNQIAPLICVVLVSVGCCHVSPFC